MTEKRTHSSADSLDDLGIASEESLADFIYETQNYTDCVEKAGQLWPILSRDDAQTAGCEFPACDLALPRCKTFRSPNGCSAQAQPQCSAANAEVLIERLVQAAAEYENNCDRLAAKPIRVELEKAKQAIRDAITGAVPQAVRTCATCHAVLADGPQPAATYEPQAASVPVEAIRAAVTLLARKITKLSWSRDDCRRKGQDVYVANLTAQIDKLDGYSSALSALVLSRPHRGSHE